MTDIDGPSLGDLTKPMVSDVAYMEGDGSRSASLTSRCRSSQR
jgi:hypothetical protein